MMTDEQKSKVAELKSVIAAGTTAEGAPREVRVAAVSLKGELRRTGTTARALAGALGVCARAGWLMGWRAGWLMGITRAQRRTGEDGHHGGAMVVLGRGCASPEGACRIDHDGHRVATVVDRREGHRGVGARGEPGRGQSKRARVSPTRRTSSRSMSFFLRRAASRRAAPARRSISRSAP